MYYDFSYLTDNIRLSMIQIFLLNKSAGFLVFNVFQLDT